MIGMMLHWPIKYPNLTMIIAKSIASLTLPGRFLIEIILHFYVFFHYFHYGRYYFVFVHFIGEIDWSGRVRDVPWFSLDFRIGGAGVDWDRGGDVLFDAGWWCAFRRWLFFHLEARVWHLDFYSVTSWFWFNFILKFNSLLVLEFNSLLIFLSIDWFILLRFLNDCLFLLLARKALIQQF